ncbi:hypothetical protein [Haloarcula salinisoli]|uniref:Uncharacterized protein n=1 Tax=Haloarcula salinisoli TaxID=2487746 RepID=A0A8J7YLK3_9EURY|nr:hypothetical protein [Halomicroarcula salinisoli]MBX0288313.1 hypothetical protein [Halomicroarcula salinisoli]MBX0305973.1 hypothetical protein [Halomicroarcula salinisoli]
MGKTDDEAIRITGTPARRRNWTTIVLEEQSDGRWLATQTGVAVTGHGETAAEAAREYCRQISESDDT